jgi:hypothetical protein
MKKECAMERFRKPNIDTPLCMFGPGGDYVSTFNAQAAAKPSEKESPLGQVLTAIAEIIGATIQPEILTEIACALPEAYEPQKTAPITQKTTDCQEATEDGVRKADHAQTTRNAPPCRVVSKEPMLFGDDWGIGGKLKYQPNHRVRTHRRTSRKKTFSPIHRQGTLFEINTCGRKTA